MRLNKINYKCTGAKLKGERIVGLKIGNGDYLYETTGPEDLNIYTIRIPSGTMVQATVYDEDSSSMYEKDYTPFISWGKGIPIVEDDSGKTTFNYVYNTVGLGLGTHSYQIKTTCKLEGGNAIGNADSKLPGDYIVDIGSVRIDYKEGYSLFAGYSGIKTVREPVLERLNTSKFTSMAYMFQQCSSLEKLNLSSFVTSKVTSMAGMFNGCSSLKSLNLSNFNTPCLTSIAGMFNGCSSLEELDLSSFDLSNVTVSNGISTISIFSGCNSLHKLYLDNCSLETVEKFLSSAYFPTNEITGKTRTIYCKKEVADALTRPTNWKFSSDYDEEEPDVPVIPPTPEEPEIPLYNPNPPEFKGDTTLIEVETMVNESHTNLSYMFYYCTNLTSVNTEDWNTSNVTNMNQMFDSCHKLTSLDLSSFDTGNVTSMMYMFYGCSKLEELDIRNWEIGTTIKTTSMFERCSSLRAVHLENCDYNTLCAIFKVLPTNTIEGVTKFVYCSQGASEEIEEPPTSWNFHYTS